MAAADLSIVVYPLDGGSPDEIDRWVSYEVSLTMKGTNTCHLRMPGTTKNRKLIAKAGGQKIEVYSHGALQFIGRVDSPNRDTSPTGADIVITANDAVGLLQNAIVPHRSLSIAGKTLQQIALDAIVDIPDITSVVLNAAASRYIACGGTSSAGNSSGGGLVKQNGEWKLPASASSGSPAGKVGKSSPVYLGTGQEQITSRIKLGTTWWAVLDDLAKQIGAHAWGACDGSLIIARPTYGGDPAAYGDGIKLLWDSTNAKGRGGNVVGVSFNTSLKGRHSEYVVAGLGKPAKTSAGADMLITGGEIKLAPVQNATKGWGTIKDPGPAFWGWNASYSAATERLKLLGMIEVETTNTQRLTRYARRKMIENALAGFSLRYEVNLHHASSGIMWVPDSVVTVTDEVNEISGRYYITEVARKLSPEGNTTNLNLWPSGLWLTDNDEQSVPWPEFYRRVAPMIWW